MRFELEHRQATNGHGVPDNSPFGGSAARSDHDSDATTSAPLAIHRLLRGRYRWAFLFIVLGIGGGVAAGFKLGQRVYRSTAQVRVISVLPHVLYNDEEKNLVPVYEAFADAQSQLIKSERVVQKAMTNPAWKTLNRPSDEPAVAGFQDAMTVEHKLEMITVSLDDVTPEGAVAGVNGVIDAYQQISQSDDRENREHRLELLKTHQVALLTDLTNLRKKEAAVATATAPADLQAEHDSQQKLVDSLAAARRAAGMEQTALKTDDPILVAGSQNPYLAERIQIRQRMDWLKASGLSDNHPQLLALKDLMTQVNQAIASHSENGDPFAKDYDAARGQLGSLSTQIAKLQDFRAEELVIATQLAETRRRIDQLQVEDEVNNRILVMAAGERPLGPYRDTRKTFGIAGGVAGALIGFGLALCFSLIDRRFRDPHDLALSSTHDPVLASIPRLRSDLVDVERTRRAAIAIHQMRMLLHARGRRGPQVFAVTSAGASSGKTSVTMALGVSFASAHSKTLLIDLDLTGAGLTASMNAVRTQALGRLMQRQGKLTESQLAAASAAKMPGRRFGEACIQLGMVSEDDVSHALDAQSQSRVGVIEAMNGQPLEECVIPTEVPRLSILPLGGATAEHASSLSLPALTRLLDEARSHYEIVIIDTGPLLGSLEGSVAAAAADGTVLVVNRGEERSRVHQGTDLLRSFRAPLAGVVFNRVEMQQLAPVSTSTAFSSSMRKQTTSAAARLQHFGPIAQAVASYVPLDDDVVAPTQNGVHVPA